MPSKDPAFKEQTCATHTGGTQPCVKNHSKKFCLEGLVWSCLGHCLETHSSVCALQRKLWCQTRHSGSRFRAPNTGHPHEAVMMPPMPLPPEKPHASALQGSLSIYELLLTVLMLILSKDDTKLTHSSYLIRHIGAPQLLIYNGILHISKWMTKEI